MGKVIAIAGKGGTGKTTISCLIIRALIEAGEKPVLAVDADPNANMNYLLGVKDIKTIGGVREEVLESISDLPPGMTKESFLELKIQEVLVEEKGFDLLVMGRPEGPGCYCYVNNILRKYMDILNKSYRYIVIDNEAGMEHLSRRTTSDIDHLFIISDPSPRGVRTAFNIIGLTEELGLNIRNQYLVINRVTEKGVSDRVKKEIAQNKIEMIGALSFDKIIVESDIMGESVFKLPDNTPTLRKIKEILEKSGILNMKMSAKK